MPIWLWNVFAIIGIWFVVGGIGGSLVLSWLIMTGRR